MLSFLVEASAAWVLLALFFVLERGFTRQVTRTVTRQVQEELVAPLERRLAGLSTRIDDLQANVDEQIEKQHSWHHDLVTAMDDMAFGNVAAALAEATRLKAIDSGWIRVQANADVKGIWLAFSYGAYFQYEQQVSDNVIMITAYPAGKPDTFSPVSSSQVSEEWRPDETLVEVAGRIKDKLRQEGHYRQPNNRPDWSLAARNVQRALGLTLPDDAPITTSLHRLTGDLAITDRGVEHLDGRLLIAIADVPSSRKGWNPPCPQGLDETAWQIVVQEAPGLIGIGRRLFPYGPSIKTWIPKGTGYNA